VQTVVSQSGHVTISEEAVASTPSRNPFTRPSTAPQSGRCVTMTLKTENRWPRAVKIINACDYAVSVLTSPLEVRVRRTGVEKLVNERMSWAAYALLYVVAEDLGVDAFRGDRIARDGGLRVRRPPAYVTVGPNATVAVPFRCGIDVPGGRYVMFLSTYEAPQGEAPTRNDPFDCADSVERHNRGVEDLAHISLGGDVREIQSSSTSVEWSP
jgi:hypothetical protein